MKKIILLLCVMIMTVATSCSSDESAPAPTPTPPTPQAKMPVVGAPTVTKTFTAFTITFPSVVYNGTDMRSVKVLVDSTAVPTITTADYVIPYSNVSSGTNPEYSTSIVVNWNSGTPGSAFKVVLAYEANGVQLYTPYTDVMLHGFKRGQRYLDTAGLQIASDNTPISQIKSVVWEVHSPTNATFLITEERKDPLMPGLQRPAFDFKDFDSDLTNTSFNKGNGPANTLRLVGVSSSQVPSGIINANGSAKVCHNIGGYLPTEGDYIAGASHLKEIFKDQTFYDLTLGGKALMTSTEPTIGSSGTTHIRTVGFTSWTTVQNGTAACIGIDTMKFTTHNGIGYATLAFKEVAKANW